MKGIFRNSMITALALAAFTVAASPAGASAAEKGKAPAVHDAHAAMQASPIANTGEAIADEALAESAAGGATAAEVAAEVAAIGMGAASGTTLASIEARPGAEFVATADANTPA